MLKVLERDLGDSEFVRLNLWQRNAPQRWHHQNLLLSGTNRMKLALLQIDW
jgi:hypothetical protein